MCRSLPESCCTKLYVNARKGRRIRDEVSPCPLCPLWLAGSCLRLGSRGLYLHQLQPAGSDRTGAAAAGGARQDYLAERFSIAAEESVTADFLQPGLEINPARR